MIIKVLAIFMLIVAAYFGWFAASNTAPLWWLGALAAATCGIGLLIDLPHIEYLCYAIAFTAETSWLASVISLSAFGWPYADIFQTLAALLPGVFLLILCIVGSAAVANNARAQAHRAIKAGSA